MFEKMQSSDNAIAGLFTQGFIKDFQGSICRMIVYLVEKFGVLKLIKLLKKVSKMPKKIDLTLSLGLIITRN